jgi:hypothetical protein
MATPLNADRLLQALRIEGLRVVEHRDWRTNNRNHKGPFGPVHGVMIHHTVTEGTQQSVELCYNGHSSLPGPLCHGVIAKDGTIYMVGNGRANHAGLGDDDALRAVIDERALPADNEANTDGNRHFYGFECVNLGDGKDPWPAAQLEAIEKAAAAICRAHGWGAASTIGHLEWQPGKVDPRGFSMDDMRARIRARLGRPAGSTPTPTPAPEEDDMAITDEDLDAIAYRVHNYRNKAANEASLKETGKPIPDAYGYDVQTHGWTKTLVAQVGALTATVTKLAEGGGLDAAEIQAAAETGARAALAELGDALTNDQEA